MSNSGSGHFKQQYSFRMISSKGHSVFEQQSLGIFKATIQLWNDQ